MSGSREFVTGTIPQLLAGELALSGSGVVVSPFGLGVLDVALGRWVYETAHAQGRSLDVPDFFGDLSR